MSTSKYTEAFRRRVVQVALESEQSDYIELEKRFNIPRKRIYNWVWEERKKAKETLAKFEPPITQAEESQNGSEPITADMLHQVEPKEEVRMIYILPPGDIVDYLERIAIALERLADVWEK